MEFKKRLRIKNFKKYNYKTEKNSQKVVKENLFFIYNCKCGKSFSCQKSFSFHLDSKSKKILKHSILNIQEKSFDNVFEGDDWKKINYSKEFKYEKLQELKKMSEEIIDWENLEFIVDRDSLQKMFKFSFYYEKAFIDLTDALKMNTKIKGKISTPINFVICKFLNDKAFIDDKKVRLYLLIIFIFFYNFLNEYGWSIVEDECRNFGFEQKFIIDLPFVECNEAEYIFTGVNEFIANYLPSKLSLNLNLPKENMSKIMDSIPIAFSILFSWMNEMNLLTQILYSRHN